MALVESADAGLRAARLGATILQLRAPGRPLRDLEGEAASLVERSPIPVLVSSRLDLALATGAAGVNLPAGDLSPAAARRLLGEEALVGRSTHSLEEALAAQEQGADYVLLGPVFETPSHAGLPPLGLQALARVAAALTIPLLAIGGVTAERRPELLSAGAAGFAAISFFQA
jgi:thiamine-phosphate pyrophosphorylase